MVEAKVTINHLWWKNMKIHLWSFFTAQTQKRKKKNTCLHFYKCMEFTCVLKNMIGDGSWPGSKNKSGCSFQTYMSTQCFMLRSLEDLQHIVYPEESFKKKKKKKFIYQEAQKAPLSSFFCVLWNCSDEKPIIFAASPKKKKEKKPPELTSGLREVGAPRGGFGSQEERRAAAWWGCGRGGGGEMDRNQTSRRRNTPSVRWVYEAAGR